MIGFYKGVCKSSIILKSVQEFYLFFLLIFIGSILKAKTAFAVFAFKWPFRLSQELKFSYSSCIAICGIVDYSEFEFVLFATFWQLTKKPLTKFIVSGSLSCCPVRFRTWTLLIQSQTCCQLHHRTIFKICAAKIAFCINSKLSFWKFFKSDRRLLTVKTLLNIIRQFQKQKRFVKCIPKI